MGIEAAAGRAAFKTALNAGGYRGHSKLNVLNAVAASAFAGGYGVTEAATEIAANCKRLV